MLGSINKLFGKILGNKSDRDIKALSPLVEKIKVEYGKLSSISNDQLRAMTADFKSTIRSSYQGEQEKINQLKIEIDALEDVDKKENLYKEVDELEKKIIEKIEDTLLDILPQAFAVVKETARRFTENEKVYIFLTCEYLYFRVFICATQFQPNNKFKY